MKPGTDSTCYDVSFDAEMGRVRTSWTHRAPGKALQQGRGLPERGSGKLGGARGGSTPATRPCSEAGLPLLESDAAVIAPGVAVMEPLLNRDGVDASAAAGILKMAAGAGFTSTGQSAARFAAARLA